MNSGHKKRILFGVAAVAIAAALFWILTVAIPRQKEHNWREHYRDASRDPYGLYVISHLLENYFPDHSFQRIRTPIAQVLPLERGQPQSSYVFIGEAMYGDTADIRVLLEYAALGNTVLLSCKSIPDALMAYLYHPEDCDQNEWEDYAWRLADSVSLRLLHPDLQSGTSCTCWVEVEGEVSSHAWHYIDSKFMCPGRDGFTPIGMGGRDINFAAITSGNGTIFLHTTPVVFTNYHQRRREAAAYAGAVFSHLPKGRIYWDEFSRVPESTGRSQNQSSSPSSSGWDDSPLAFLLSHPPLAWAWYLLLALALLYLLFRAKRRQRIIPTLPANINASRELIRNIGHLYYTEKKPSLLAALKFKLFLHDVRERYRLISKDPGDAFVEELAGKSGVNTALIREIVVQQQSLPMSYNQDESLAKLHALISDFYRQCR